MSTSSEINAIYYAIRLVSHRADVSRLQADDAGLNAHAEFGPEEVRHALNIVSEIQMRENAELRSLSESAVGRYVSFYSERIEELSNKELAESGFDMNRADNILERLRGVAVGTPVLEGHEIPDSQETANSVGVEGRSAVNERDAIRPGRPGGLRADESRSKTRVLVVDDAPDVVEMLAVLLGHAGYEVTTASSAVEALQLARAGAFDLVISDVGSPAMNSYQLLAALRELPNYESVPIIVVTAFSSHAPPAVAARYGFDAVLIKPIDSAELISTAASLAPTRGGGR